MRSLRWSALAALVAVCACGSADRVGPIDGSALLEPAVVDFGRVALGAGASKTVVLRNIGRASLSVQRVAIPGLGDEVVVTNDGGDRLAPGEATQLTVRFAPRKEEVLDRRLVVAVDDRDAPEVEVPVIGVGVRPRVDADPRVVDFGKLELGFPETRTVTLTNAFDMAVAIELERVGDDQFTVDRDGRVEVPPDTRVPLEVTFDPERAGPVEGRITLTPCPTCAPIGITLRGEGIDRALVVSPPELDFGDVPIDRFVERSITLQNVGTRPLTILGLALSGQHPAFSIDETTATLTEGERVTLEARFAPTRLGEDEDLLEIRSTSRRVPVTKVRFLGTGGGPEITVVPESLSFGSVPLGARPQRLLTVSNAGADPTLPPLVITQVEVTAGPFSALLPVGPISLAPGATAQIPVEYEPQIEGADEALLRLHSNDASTPEAQVSLHGTAFLPPPCELSITPEILDFAALDPDRGAVLGFRVRNIGPDICVLRKIDIAAGSHPAFSLPGGRIESFVLGPQMEFGRMVAFDPYAVEAGPGRYEGELELFAVNSTPDRYVIPLHAMSARGCLTPDPRFVDFGSSRIDCGAHVDSVRYTNTCSASIRILDIAIGLQSTEEEFELTRRPAFPFDLPAGASFEVSARWTASTRGPNFAPLLVTEDNRPAPLLVPLLGDSTQDGQTTDRFTQHASGTVDVLLVVDNSSSMAEEQARVSSAVGVLVDEAVARGVDFHLGVTTSGLTEVTNGQSACPGGANGGEAGRLFPVDGSRPRILTPQTSDAAGVLAQNVQVGLCHHLEQGLEAMRLALSAPLATSADDRRTSIPNDGNAGFLRNEAQLAVIFIGEEDDHSGYPVSSYETFLRELKGHGGAIVSAIVDLDDRCSATSGVATRYLDLVDRMGGSEASICESDWSAIFRQIAERSFTPRGAFPLSQVPDASGVRVFVDGAASAATSYRYDAATNSISFTSGAAPRAGARVEVHYRAACR